MTTLLYLSLARLPTEKAHGFQICKMCEAFAARGVDVELWHPRRKQSDAALETDIFSYYGIVRSFGVRTLRNIDVFSVERLLPSRAFRAAFVLHQLAFGLSIARRARRTRHDFVFTRDVAVAYWLNRSGVDFAFEVHTIPSGPRVRLLRSLVKGPGPRLWIALTTPIRDDLVALGVAPDRICVSADGVDVEAFSGISKETSRQSVGLASERPIVGYVGSLRALGLDKGVATLARAVGRVDPPATLLVVGGPADAAGHIERVARAAGLEGDRLVMVDRVRPPEVPPWIAACDVVTIPWEKTEFSDRFTSPLKLFEYMAAGVPIVASDLQALRDVLRDGENALLVEPGDEAGLAGAISRLLRDPLLASALAENARKTVERFSWRRRAAAILDRMEKAGAGVSPGIDGSRR